MGLIDRIGKLVSRNSAPVASTDTEKELIGTQQAESPQYTGYSVYDWYSANVDVSIERKEMYKEFETMDTEDTEISSALDLYADNATQGNSDEEECITISTEDENVKELFEKVKKDLALDVQVWSIVREIAKYGDCFEEIVVDSNLMIKKLKHLPCNTMERCEDRYGELEDIAFKQEGSDNYKRVDFRKWQVIHFRLQKERESIYGQSILSPIRKVWKQLCMMEDALVIARLSRSSQRYAYIVDTEGLDPESSLEYIEKVKKSLRKRKTIDIKTGKMDMSFNPMSIEEDVFLGTKSGGRSDVKVLEGQLPGVLSDIEYMQNKKFAGIKVPKAYLGVEKDVNAKATLTEQDVQFARSVRRMQFAVQDGLRQLFDTVLLLNGIAPSTVEYSIGLPVISTIDEIRTWEIEKIKLEVGQLLKSTVSISNRWIYRNLLNMTDEEIEELEKEQDEEIRNSTDRDNELLNNSPQFQIQKDVAYANIEKSKEDKDKDKDKKKKDEEIDLMNLSTKDLMKVKRLLRKDIETLDLFTKWKMEGKS